MSKADYVENNDVYRRLVARQSRSRGFGIVLMSGPYRKELSAGFRLTTNNRMELMAVIVGLETLENNGSERSMPRSAYCRDVSIRRCRAKRCRERVSSLFGT